MRKISWEYTLLFLQMTFVGIFILVMYSYYISTEQKNFFESFLYTLNRSRD